MATRQEAKQLLIDRIDSIAPTITSVKDANFLAKAIRQIGADPRYYDTNRETPTDDLRLEDPDAKDSNSVSPIHNGVHREEELTHTSYLVDGREPCVQGSTSVRKNFQNDATLGNRPEFGIWSNHSDAHGCGTTWDAYLRPVDRRQYYASGSHWQGGSEGGPCTGSYSSHQKHQQGTINNNCYLQCQTDSGSNNTSNVYNTPTRTTHVSEVGHYRIKMGTPGIATCRIADAGNQMKREATEVGTCQIDNRQAYVKMKGRVLSIRERWMPPEHQTWTENQAWPHRETFESPTYKDIFYGYDVGNNQVQAFQPGYGTLSYHKQRQEFAFFNQVTTGSSVMIGKVYRHVDRIRRLSLLDDILKEEDAVYFTFNYGTGFNSGGTDQIEPQRCAKFTMTDDGTMFTTMLDPGTSTFALGKINNDWYNATNGIVQHLVIKNAGSGYTSAPTITIADPNGSGTAAVGTLTIDTATGRVNGYTLTNAGSGYSLAKEDRWGHPLVTVDNTGTNGSGCEIVSCIKLSATFTNIATKSCHATVYGRGTTSLQGQMFMMSKDRSKTVHFAPYYGYGCGMVSFLIDRKTNSWTDGYSNTDTSNGCQVIPFREGQFIHFIGRNWAGTGDHEAYLYYEEAEPTIDANDNNKHLGWKSDNVGHRLDHGIGATSRPVAIPLW